MNPPPAALSRDDSKAQQETPSVELGPARKRERLVQQVRAAGKRLPQTLANPLVRTR
jgi:hypothetical protein